MGMKKDWRYLGNGLEIPTQSYSDQPYILKTDDGAWLCCVTTGAGEEGARGQHVATMRSADKGRSWTAPVPVEALDSPENSYAVMLKVPSGRIYIFYNHNTDDVREVKCHDCVKTFDRVDSLGHFVFKYSDDHGRSWSPERYDIPFRLFNCDRENVYDGKICFFWNVGKPFEYDESAFVPLIKVGQMGEGFFQQSEGALLKSDNILSEKDPVKIRWETLPDGDIGLRTPPGGGPIAEEQSYVVLSDGSFHVVYRTVDGYPVEAYSRDGGHSWSTPQYMRYADGRTMKNPRAANLIWKCQNGKYLYWFHNHGGHFIREMWEPPQGDTRIGCPYDDRNPAWLCGGVEIDSPEGRIIRWGEPEIVLYDDDPLVRISYPDLIEDAGSYFISETQKNMARVHEIPKDFIDSIWSGLEMELGDRRFSANSANPGILLDVKNAGKVSAPALPEFFSRDYQRADYGGKSTRQGFAIEMILSINSLRDDIIVEGRREDGRGLALSILGDGRLELIMNDGWMEQRMSSEPCLKTGSPSHIVVNVDGGPRIVSFIVNGRFCDGGEYRQFGWQRFSPFLRHVNWSGKWTVNHVEQLKVYDRVLMAADAASAGMIHNNLSN